MELTVEGVSVLAAEIELPLGCVAVEVVGRADVATGWREDVRQPATYKEPVRSRLFQSGVPARHHVRHAARKADSNHEREELPHTANA